MDTLEEREEQFEPKDPWGELKAAIEAEVEVWKKKGPRFDNLVVSPEGDNEITLAKSRTSKNYSYLSAIIGSTRIARRAGI